jgi:putative membrane protein
MGWHVHPDVLLWIFLIEFTYLYGLRVVGARQGLRATRGQIAAFTAGVAALYVAAGTPIHDLAEQRLLSVHMAQHMLFTLVAPPLLLLGTPGWLVRPLLRLPGVYPVARFVTHPVAALLIFNFTTLVTHLPSLVDFSLRHHTGHFFIHVVLILTAVLMWMPVLSPLPELARLTPPAQMAYLFIQSLVPAVLASFITFSRSVLYDFYAAAPRTWGLSALTDQLIAGLFMKLAGGAILWLAIGIVFFRWVSAEERASAPRPLRWEEVEEELQRMGLTGPGAPR